jgi:hypothetical protein
MHGQQNIKSTCTVSVLTGFSPEEWRVVIFILIHTNVYKY